MRFRALVHGSGSVEVPGYGIGDAEAQTEKELARALPGVRVTIRGVRRMAADPRIVEEFRIEYRFVAALDVESESEEGAGREAYSAVRRALQGTRFERGSLDRVDLESE